MTQGRSRLRIYADFNSGGNHGDPCWCLKYGPNFQHLDDVALELSLRPGLFVTLYYSDEAEEFEVEGRLERHAAPPVWQALPDWTTMRRIRG